MSWLVGTIVSVLCRLVPATIGIRYWQRYTKGQKAFIILLAYDALGIIIGAFLAYYYKNNVIVSNIYVIAEVFLLSLFFSEYVQSKSAKKLLTFYPFLFGIFTITISVGFTGVHQNNPFATFGSSIFIIVFGAVALAQIVSEDKNLIRQGDFWIVTGLLSFYLLNVGYLSTNKWLIANNSPFLMDLFLILQYSFYVVNTFYAIGLSISAFRQKHLQQPQP